jgi:hypothetical protein
VMQSEYAVLLFMPAGEFEGTRAGGAREVNRGLRMSGRTRVEAGGSFLHFFPRVYI